MGDFNKAVSLPKVKSKALQNLQDYTIGIYGREKIGKTSLCAHFPDTIFLSFEPGCKALEVYQVVLNDWPDFTNILKQLQNDKKFKTVVVDTVDIMYRYCLEWVQKSQLKNQHPGDCAFGKGWDRLKSEFSKRIAQLCNMDKGVVFISHETVREEEKANGRKVETIQPSMSGVARGVIEPMLDLIGYYYYDGDGDRVLQIEGSKDVTAGCRMKEAGFFADCDAVDMGSSSKQAYKNLCEAMALPRGKRRK